MFVTADALAALMLGFAGSTHCVFMCGGIHGALVTSSSHSAQYMPLFNLGRVASYSFFGFLFGSVGLALQASAQLLMAAKIIAAVLLLLMAAYVGRWWQGLTALEKLGAPIWQVIQPFANRLMPIQSPVTALAAGALWGWLPCGLVYSTLAWAMLSGSPTDAALRMFFFGLGTMPALFGTGFMADKLARYLKSRVGSHVAALILVVFAIWTLLPLLQQWASGGEPHHHSPDIPTLHDVPMHH